MTDEVVFVSDFFIDEVAGGAEFCNEALIGLLKKNYTVKKKKSIEVTPEFICSNDRSFFIIANFFQLSEKSKAQLRASRYAILEHDHKYIRSNNPALFVDFVAPESQVINKEFYRYAKAVVCQSLAHSRILQKNLFLNNICNFGGNIWTEDQLQVLERNIDRPKTIDYGIIQSTNRNKGMPAAIKYCKDKNFQFELLPPQGFEKFIANLASVDTLVFFPQWFESYSRLAVEARILGCKLVTNSLLGVSSEKYFSKKGRDLLEAIRENNTNLLNKWTSLIDLSKISYISPLECPTISVIVSLYKGEKYIKGFLEDLKAQTVFDKCEVIIIDAASPENEEKYILDFMKNHDNVIYKKLDKLITVMEAQNMAIGMATGELIAQACVDDRHAPDCLEVLAKHLVLNEEIDLAYGDCYQTTKLNETFLQNSSGGQKYEHSLNDFSRENMIKCLPGPMPMWKKSLHEKIGLFREDLAHAGDWDFFLRAVNAGSIFQKVDRPIGLYLFNESGLSTSPDHARRRLKEECEIFERYKHIFGEKNYKQFRNHFHQYD